MTAGTVKITAIETQRLRLPLDPPFAATGYGSGDAMTGFARYTELFIGREPVLAWRS